ncbi:meiotic nuclear division protein 1 [Cokeromyces recurvatus]|uniref:meiotic nuclear division protein 1 n=1 Tax=Cokeromyces recurvatus TaxID=90255 RepID=UPI0022207EF9|nr:meiotic nuclear division protein 1 [Cokeromyces recurvatus]KAI7900697.1 meiotic nuclear division protein 1 [Cokeromyces recurvatus]
MSRKGLTLDEKRKRIERIFHETGEFYQLKDIEKIGPKKGVVLQSVKDVLMSLVDDGLVMTDKIGTSNYFWSYPSAAIETKRNKLSDISQKVDKEVERKAKLEELIEEAKEDREQSEEREELLRQLKEQQRISKELNAELQKYKDNDPALYKAKENAAKMAKEAVNRWTENIWEIESYCINKFGMDRKVFEQSFGIDDDFDTI